MFKFNLYSARKTLKAGLILFVPLGISLIIFICLLKFGNTTVEIVFTVIFGILSLMFLLLSIANIIFGAVVYKSLETSNKLFTPRISKLDNKEINSLNDVVELANEKYKQKMSRK